MNAWAWTFFGAWVLAEIQVIALLRGAKSDTGEWSLIVEGSAA